jgi:hypothetical protein
MKMAILLKKAYIIAYQIALEIPLLSTSKLFLTYQLLKLANGKRIMKMENLGKKSFINLMTPYHI